MIGESANQSANERTASGTSECRVARTPAATSGPMPGIAITPNAASRPVPYASVNAERALHVFPQTRKNKNRKNNSNRNWRLDTNGAKLDPAAGSSDEWGPPHPTPAVPTVRARRRLATFIQ
jgi:hypothetical protein